MRNRSLPPRPKRGAGSTPPTQHKYYIRGEAVMTIKLYVKTHNETGLKYFGKTVNQNAHTYRGSGTYWLRHIKQHGYDVTTEIVGEFIDIEECRKVAIQFCIEHDVVKSAEWANLEVETVDGFGNFRNKEVRDKAAKTRELLQCGVQYDRELRDKGVKRAQELKVGIMDPTIQLKGRLAALEDDSRRKRLETFFNHSHQQGERNNQYGTMWITNGHESVKIRKNDPVPDGWWKGRVMSSKQVNTP
jgi:hypothetical protein